MRLQDICVSLELAKQLKEAGYPQEGALFYWIGDEENHVRFNLGNFDASETMDCYAAPTASEIGEKLPKMYTQKKNGPDNVRWFPVYYWTSNEIFYAIWHKSGEGLSYKSKYEQNNESIKFEAGTEADAGAKMYLYLKKEGLI